MREANKPRSLGVILALGLVLGPLLAMLSIGRAWLGITYFLAGCAALWVPVWLVQSGILSNDSRVPLDEDGVGFVRAENIRGPVVALFWNSKGQPIKGRPK